MAFEAFLKIDSIDGDSTAAGHENWIELFSYGWGATEPIVNARTDSGGGAAVRPSPQPFSFMKATDKASPELFLKMCEGTNFQKVSLACRKAGGSADFVKIDFFDVFISSYSEGGATATDLQPLESISFVFSKVSIQAASVSSEGEVGPFSSAGFDFETDKPFTPATGG